MQSFKKTGLKLYEKLQSQGTYSLYIWGQEMTKIKKLKKVTKTKARIIWQVHAHLQTMEKTCKVSKRLVKLYEELCSRNTHCLDIEGEIRMSKFTMWKKKVKKKNDLTITSKQHAHPHTIKKTRAKFHNTRYKTVRGVALTRGTHCLYIEGEKWLSSQNGKSDKNLSNNFI